MVLWSFIVIDYLSVPRSDEGRPKYQILYASQHKNKQEWINNFVLSTLGRLKGLLISRWYSCRVVVVAGVFLAYVGAGARHRDPPRGS